MLMLPILTLPAPSLRERSRALSSDEIGTQEFQLFLDDLIRTMIAADGVGIASPQVGRNVRAIVVRMPQGPTCFLNPEIKKKSTTMIDSEEACLSVPGLYGLVRRHKRISGEALDRHGRRVELSCRDFPAIVLQHEIDHLDGILFIDKALKTAHVKKGRHL